MTRPMPEPLECTCMSRGNACWTCLDTIGWDPEEECPSCPVHAGPSYNETKRLTTPECAAHEWQADAELERAARNLDDDYYNPHRFRLRAEYERRLDEWDTWVEFTLRPHALEES